MRRSRRSDARGGGRGAAAQQPEGPARTRATAAAQAVSTLIGPIDLDRHALAYAPDLRLVDHRVFATWSSESGAELLDHFRTQLDLAPDFAARVDEVLALESDGLLVRIAYHGTSRDSGGAFENLICNIIRFGDDGRMSEIECFEAEQEAEALARFEALFGSAAAEPARDPFENAAARADRLLFDRFNARDWPGIEALAAPDLIFDERRRMLRNSCGRDVWLEQFRVLFDVPASRFTTKLLATRGERLSLNLHCFTGEVAGGGGPLAMEDHLVLHEVDREGRIVAIVLFDLEDEEAAYDELDARFAAGEGAAHRLELAAFADVQRATRNRDWDGLVESYALAFVMRDHRRLGWGTLVNDAATFARVVRSAVDLAPDAKYRQDHLRLCARGRFARTALCGTRDGGAFENPFLRVTELDEQGRILRDDVYDESEFERARARFAELDARDETGLGPFENAASRAWRAAIDAWRARDVARFEALHPRALRYRDRRRLFQLDLDRQGFLDFTHPLLTMRTGSMEVELLATRGERLALMRFTMTMEDETVGPSAIDSLLLIETDERGEIAAYDRWDLADEDAAWAEIEARWEAGEGREHAAVLAFRRNFNEGLARRDWDAMAAGYAPEFVGEDHRLVGWGTLRGSAFVAGFRTMFELAPDARLRWDHLRVSGRTLIAEAIWLGTRDGGAFESPFILVAVLDARGKALRSDFYDPHHLDRALARFEEILANESRDPLAALVKPNLATASMERSWIAFDAVDLGAAGEALEAARAYFAPDFVWDDRRPIVGLSGGLELMMASARERLASGARHERRTIVGTAGDRVAVARVLWAGGPPDGRFEVEFLVVQEVDEAGLVTATIFFEPDDTRKAQREAWARWFAIDPAARQVAEPIGALMEAFNEHDAGQFRALLADDLVVEDHRLAGLGRIDGADAYVASIVALLELAPDTRGEMGLLWPAFDRHGAITVLRRGGQLRDGGEFESIYLYLLLVARGRIHHAEMFELEHLDAALARFEALRPGNGR